MPSTRSGRDHASQAVSPENKKRKADASSPSSQSSKRGKPAKQQTTIEETIDPEGVAGNQQTNGTTDQSQNGEQKTTSNGTVNGSGNENGHAVERDQSGDQATIKTSAEDTAKESNAAPTNGESKSATDNHETKPDQKQHEDKQANKPQDVEMTNASSGDDDKTQEQQQQNDATKSGPQESAPADTSKDAIQNDSQREQAMPSNILEKGIIYFFTRGRVGIDEPDSVQDLQRSHVVLRPLPQGGKITDGGVQDSNNVRLLALPKKVFPKSGKDKFMMFVEKAKTSMKELKEDFFQGSEYSTQTVGVRHTPSVAPIGEGVYAITSTGGGQGTTHLAYMLTIPNEIGQVQSDVGITDKGSFILSLKNPDSSGPSYAQLPQKPDFPQEAAEEFRGRGWMPLHPKYLDYANAQMLIIGEDFESSDNLEPKPKDEQDEKKTTPGEELQKLEDEDEHRIQALKGDDTIYVDLGVSKNEYGLLTTW